MTYIYGEFSDKQIEINASIMHSEIHKLLLHKDPNITKTIFNNENDFLKYFKNLLIRYGGLNEILGEPDHMVAFMATLQAAYDEIQSPTFQYDTFRRLILDAHGYIKAMFESEV